MPQIIVTAGDSENLEGAVTLRERINMSDFESECFTVNLVERLGWAVGDAAQAEQQWPRVHDDSEPVEGEETTEPETAPELIKA